MYESADLIGAFYPYLPESDGWDATDDEIVLIDQIRKQFGDEKPASNMAAYLREALSMESVRNLIREHYNIPDDSEVQYLTESAWVKMGKRRRIYLTFPKWQWKHTGCLRIRLITLSIWHVSSNRKKRLAR